MDLAKDGYTILRSVLSGDQCRTICDEVAAALLHDNADAIQASQSRIVGGRNLISLWSGWQGVLRSHDVTELIQQYVGPDAGLVRILYFDKPPGESWSLSLHRDKTIAVAQHHVPAEPFAKPTIKAGTPHVEATEHLLQNMLTLRIHLDPMCDANGPLVVVPGTHLELSQTCTQASIAIHCDAGDIFVMRPLLLHGSRSASPSTTLHRRVVHLEFAPSETLPSPYRWSSFVSVRGLRLARSEGSL